MAALNAFAQGGVQNTMGVDQYLANLKAAAEAQYPYLKQYNLIVNARPKARATTMRKPTCRAKLAQKTSHEIRASL